MTSSADAGAETELAIVPGDAGLPRPGDGQNNSTLTCFILIKIIENSKNADHFGSLIRVFRNINLLFIDLDE